MNHIEDVLASSLLGFLITATLSVFAAVYVVRSDAKLRLPPLGIFVGIAIFYLPLAGYYYFMLAHFYGAAAVLAEVAASEASGLGIDIFWSIFQTPVFNETWGTRIGLLSAPVFPLLFSSGVLIAVWLMLRTEDRRAPGRIALLAALGVHVAFCWWMMWLPFSKFLQALGL